MSGSNYSIAITDASIVQNNRLQAGGFTPFVCGDISKRIDPKQIMPEAKSVIVVGVPYGSASFYSNLSSLGVCEDYHKRARDVLKAIATELNEVLGSFRYKILVDGPTLCERSLAVRAGLGFFGKNGLVISPEYGTRFNIGVMLTDISLVKGFFASHSWLGANCAAQGIRRETNPIVYTLYSGLSPAASAQGFRRETNPIANAQSARRSGVSFMPFGHPETRSEVEGIMDCPGGCNLCIDACPNGALREGEPLDAGLCISYLTQKDNLTSEEENLLHGQLYGCDICQNACPKNKKHESLYIDPKEILEISDSEITEKYRHTAMNWKIELLKRNALISVNSELHKSPDFLR